MPSDYENQNQLAEFRFVGSSNAISVSDESKARAEDMFGNCTIRFGDLIPHNAKACNLKTYVEMPTRCSQGRDGCGGSPTMKAFPGFDTAGQRNPITITKEQLAKASLLLNGDSSPMRAKEPPVAHASATLQCESADLPVTRESVLNKASAGVSQNTGSRSSISAKVVARAPKVLLDSHIEGVHQSSKVWSIYDDKEEPRDGCEPQSATFEAVEIFEEERHALEEGCVKESLTNQLDVQESTLHQPDLTAGFCIAGSSKTITVSADQLATATSLLLDGHGQSENAGQQHFQTAGRNKDMPVTADQLKQPAKPGAYDKQSGALAGSTGKSDFSGFEGAESNTSISLPGGLLSDTRKRLDGNESANGCETNRRDSLLIEVSSTIGFRTAGSSQAISVSEEQLANARGLLIDRPFEIPRATVPLHLMRQTSSKYPTVASSAETGLAGASNSASGFQTARSGKNVAIAEKSVKKSETLLGDDFNNNESQPQKSISKPPDGQTGFKTAGTNEAITLSNEQLLVGEQLLLDCYDTQSKGSNTNVSTNETGGSAKESRKMIRLPNEGATVAEEPYGATIVSSFATAGSGNSISVSKEEMAKASHLLKDDAFNHRSSKIPGDSDTCGSETCAFVPFRSAGSDAKIHICEEHLNIASDLLSNDRPSSLRELSKSSALPTTGFQMAGSGKSIRISEEQMRDAQRLITGEGENRDQAGHKHETSEICRPDSTLTDPCVGDVTEGGFAKTNVSAVSGGACDIEMGSAAAKPRVRFSLDSTSNKGNDRSLMPTGFSFAGSARKVPVNQASLDRASRIFHGESSDFVTPYSDQNSSPHAKMKENFADNCHAGNGPNIVTETKCASRLGDGNDPTKVRTSTPPTAVSHTPMQDIPTAFDESLQSVMKSKRLFDESQCERKEADVEEGSAQQRGSFAGAGEYYKVSLRKLARGDVKKVTWKGCIENGLQEVTLRVTSSNATKLRFKREDGSPLFLFGQGVPPKCAYTGKVGELNDWLIDQGCDESLLCTKWIQNHYRWIVWKLAAMERRFPVQLGGQYLNYEHVKAQLKSRYERELVAAKRPAVRKILNKDVAAGIPIILCVSQVLRFRSKKPDGGVTEGLRLELTDGWYSIPALVDSVLAIYVEKGTIQVGSKIAVCNAQLAGSDDGVDPLDDSYDSSKRNCPLLLKITANCTRPAKWHARLGLVPPKFLENHAGTILVKSLDDIHPNGGSIPAIDLVVCKAYRRMYREELISANKQVFATNHLTEAEESSRQREFESKDQRAREKLADSAQKECLKVRLSSSLHSPVLDTSEQTSLCLPRNSKRTLHQNGKKWSSLTHPRNTMTSYVT